jgi:glycosyltransferase involved in cell wall biosynthesis
MARFLEQCIASVLEQSYTNIEYLIIDGSSTDGSIDIIRRYEKRLSFWISEPDNGQSHAINKGFARASGDVLCWLNADDYFLPQAIQEVADAYERNSDAPFYFGDGLRVDENGREKSGYFPDGVVRYGKAALLRGLNYILQPAAFINRRHLTQIGLVNEALHFGMDSDLWMRLAAIGKPQTIQAKLAASREYADTKTSTGSFERIEELRRISYAHTSLEMTPGVLCYMFDELLRYSHRRPELLSNDFQRKLRDLWAATSNQFHRFGARPDGFPLRDDE